MNRKLIIDLAACQVQEHSGVQCSYKHHPENRGLNALLEMVRFALICRRCEAAPCVKACPQGALAKREGTNGSSGALQRAVLLCTGCGSCALACPFGSVYPELIPYPSSVCDLCHDRLGPDEKPLCVQTCSDGSLAYEKVHLDENTLEVFPDVVVRVTEGSTWQREVKTRL